MASDMKRPATRSVAAVTAPTLARQNAMKDTMSKHSSRRLTWKLVPSRQERYKQGPIAACKSCI